MATGLPAGRYLAGGIRGLTLRPEPPALGRDEVETNVIEEENGNNGRHAGGVWRGGRCPS